MPDGPSRAQSFGISSADPLPEKERAHLRGHLRGVYARATDLRDEAAALRRAVDELDAPARSRLLPWAELLEQCLASFTRGALHELDGARPREAGR